MKKIIILMFLSANFVIAMNHQPISGDLGTRYGTEKSVRRLHIACIAGNFDAVVSILEAVENPYLVISTPDINGYTALHWAAQNEDINILSYFLGIAWQIDELGSYINMRTKKDCLALDLAYMSNNPPHKDMRAIIRLLEEDHQNNQSTVMVPATVKEFISSKSELAKRKFHRNHTKSKDSQAS